LTGSKVPDAQSAYESANTIGPAVLGGVNFVLHAAGWLEGGLVSSYEKFVMDADQLDDLSLLTRGAGRLEDSLRIQAAWTYLKRTGLTQQALAKALGPNDHE